MTLSVDFAGVTTLVARPASPDGQRASAAVEGVITSVAYTEADSRNGGAGAVSTYFYDAEGVAIAPDGTLFIAEDRGNRVRKVTSDGFMSTVAGDGTAGDGGDDGPATAARVRNPQGLALDAEGNLFIAESTRVRKVSLDGKITTVVGDLDRPVGLAFDSAGNLYFSESGKHRVRRMTPDRKITTVAGIKDSSGFSGDHDSAPGAQLKEPRGLCVDEVGNLYIADRGNHRVRKVAPDGIITTIAGTGQATFGGDGGPVTEAHLHGPSALVRDIDGSLYIATSDDHRVRKVSRDGTITTVAGTGEGAFSGDNEQAAKAKLKAPRGLALDQYGNLYIAEWGNNRVRKVTGPQERSLTLRQVKVPQAALGEITEFTVEITAYHPGQAVDAGRAVQRFTAPTGFAFAEWPTYSYNGNDAWQGSLGSRFERDRSVMVVTSDVHLNTRAEDKGPLVYTLPVKAVAAVDPATYHNGQMLLGRHPGIRLSATVTAGAQFSVTPSWPPTELVRGSNDARYPGVEVHRAGPVPAQTVTAVLPPGAGLAFRAENEGRHQMTVLSHAGAQENKYDAELSDDGKTLTCRNVDLGLSQQHPLSAVWVAVTATATATAGPAHLTFQVGGATSNSTIIQIA